MTRDQALRVEFKPEASPLVSFAMKAETTASTAGRDRVRRFRATPSVNPMVIESGAIIHTADIPALEFSSYRSLSFCTP